MESMGTTGVGRRPWASETSRARCSRPVIHAADISGVMFRLFRRLVGLSISFAVVMAVLTYLGPGLAARSMNGYISGLGSAQAGDIQRADSIGAQLTREWASLSAGVTRAVHGLEAAVARLAPR